MSTVFVGHTGQRLAFDPSSVNTLEALRSFVAQHAIPQRTQILLTSQGKQVRTQTLLTENELFVFDSSLLTSRNATSPSSSELQNPSGANSEFQAGSPPDTISDQTDLHAWQSLFRLRSEWANELLHGCAASARQSEKYQDEQAIIERSLDVAVASLQQHIKSAGQKYGSAESWSEEVIQDHERQMANWEANLQSLRSMPARMEFTRFIQLRNSPLSRRLSQQGSVSTLQGFVDVVGIRKAADGARDITTEFAQRMMKMQDDLASARSEGDDLLRAVDQINAQSTTSSSSEPGQLLDEIQMVVKKMSSDLTHVQSLPSTPQCVSQASKMALLHTRNYLPNLNDYALEMNELLQRTRQQRNSAAQTALEHMRTLSAIESTLADLYQDMKALELPQDEGQFFATLGVVSRLPSVYGALLVESVRRREWVAKMKRDSETLQEEVATYQYEEDKRRKKWIQSVEDICKPELLGSSVLGIDLSLQNEGGSWPVVTRDELQDYLKLLLEVYGQCEVTQEMDQAIKDLDKPTRKQIKHAKAFKSGSMHEAAFGDTSLLLRGDEQHKALREMNSRLEEELKGQKSRVRKLEDLLHRQTHISRASTANMFMPQNGSTTERQPTSPAGLTSPNSDELAKNRHRRMSSTTKEMEEKRLARRVVDLEAELQAAKDEASSRRDSDIEIQKQVDEALSTKKDLMENMEAQQREFATERRGLEKELAEAKERIEEVENEIERLTGSRDDERTGVYARAAAFEEEVSRLKEEAMGHAARAATEQDTKNAMEQKLGIAEAARAEAESRLRELQEEQERRRETDAEHLQLLATAHAHLSSDMSPQSDLAGLAAALEELSRRSTAQNKDLAEAVAFAKSENGSLWASNERQKTELASAAEKQAETDKAVRRNAERLGVEEAKVKSLEQQLSEEQQQLMMLRSKFADGETGSEVLRQRVADEEARAGKLSSELAETKSHVNSLDVELMRLQKKHKEFHNTAEVSKDRLEKRAEHAKDISQRLFAQNSRLSRLLERLGLAVSYQDGEMSVERASKISASTTIVDPHSQLNRTVSLSSPPPTRKTSTADEPTADLAILHWSDARTLTEETEHFEAFVQQVSRFNVDTFSDAVVKRYRDFEYTARKYNKEAKESNKRADAYKERYMKFKGEAHAKIAVRDFKEGDLALFLPTRGQAKGAWAAFNINCPHYFLAEKEGMRLGTRDFIVGRISKIEQKIVDLSKSKTPNLQHPAADGRSIDENASDATSFMDNNDNPFDLSDGLTWWLVHVAEERGAGGAPSTPGLGKSTVAAANVDAKGSIRIKRGSKGDDASKHLNKSLDSRRSSSTSKKGVPGTLVPSLANATSGSPTVSTFADATAARPRSESQTSGKPPPTVGGSTSATGPAVATSGLGIVSNSGNVPSSPSAIPAPSSGDPPQHPQHDQIPKLAVDTGVAPSSAAPDPYSASSAQQQRHFELPARQRSRSPSKSIRSLQRHLLDPQAQQQQQSPAKSQPSSPARSSKSPSKQQQQQPKQAQGWEPLWQAEFSMESPSKGGGNGGK